MYVAEGIFMELRNDEQLDFDAMDSFITSILAILREQGGRAVKVFPPDAAVLLAFSERLANEVVRIFPSPDAHLRM